MTDRRNGIRLKRILDSTVFCKDNDFPATIVDISRVGIAFEITNKADLHVGDEFWITLYDDEVDTDGMDFIYNMIGYVRDIVLIDANTMRCGCVVTDPTYSQYVQDQITMIVSGIA